MARVLLLGAGLVTRPLVRYLLAQPGLQLTIASRTISKAEALLEGHPQGHALALLVEDEAALAKQVAAHDLSISLLPYVHHVRVANLCLQHGRPLVTTSYISPAMRALDERARAAGILLLNEIGVDPGLDHMSAMRVIHDVQARGGKVTAFSSYCGGLPAAEANTNPWGYKFSWSPRGVLMAGKNASRFLKDGKVVDIPGPELFAHHEAVEVPGGGTYEGYPNRDCLGYIDQYGLQGIASMFRGTLRYPGWSETMRQFVKLGYLDETPRADLAGRTFKDLAGMLVPAAAGKPDVAGAVAAHLGIPKDSDPMRRFTWLGLFSDERLPEAPTVLDVMVARMLEKLAYAPGERDLLLMHHAFRAEFPDHKEAITSTLVDFGIPNGDTSMARTVSLPAAIATRMILEGKILMTGVRAPVVPEIYEPVLRELETMKIVFHERTQKL